MNPTTKNLPLLSFSYDGAPDSSNCCPNCHEVLFWHDLQPFGEAKWMTCDDCEIFCDVRTGEVFVGETSPKFAALIAMYGNHTTRINWRHRCIQR